MYIGHGPGLLVLANLGALGSFSIFMNIFRLLVDEIDEVALEEEAEKKVGWLLKVVFMATAGVVAWQFFPVGWRSVFGCYVNSS